MTIPDAPSRHPRSEGLDAALTVGGALLIVSYAVVGALVMNIWAVVAASGLPLPDTISAMSAANQPYTTIAGILFATLGIVLAVAWATVRFSRAQVPGWASLASWSVILAAGAVAYFFASFANLNSVGDTFMEWNAAAAWQWERPLYVISGLALIVAVTAFVVGIVRSATVGRPALV